MWFSLGRVTLYEVSRQARIEAMASGQAAMPGELLVAADFDPSVGGLGIAPNQRAALRIDGPAWKHLAALPMRVREVGRLASNGGRHVGLGFEPSAAGLDLQPGLTGTVEIAVEATSPMMLLLRSIGLATPKPTANRQG